MVTVRLIKEVRELLEENMNYMKINSDENLGIKVEALKNLLKLSTIDLNKESVKLIEERAKEFNVDSKLGFNAKFNEVLRILNSISDEGEEEESDEGEEEESGESEIKDSVDCLYLDFIKGKPYCKRRAPNIVLIKGDVEDNCGICKENTSLKKKKSIEPKEGWNGLSKNYYEQIQIGNPKYGVWRTCNKHHIINNSKLVICGFDNEQHEVENHCMKFNPETEKESINGCPYFLQYNLKYP